MNRLLLLIAVIAMGCTGPQVKQIRVVDTVTVTKSATRVVDSLIQKKKADSIASIKK